MALNFPLDPQNGDIYEGYTYDSTTESWTIDAVNYNSVLNPANGKLNKDIYTNGKDILLDAERVLFGTVTGVTTSGSNTLYHTNGTAPNAPANFGVGEGNVQFAMIGSSAQGTEFETNLGLMGPGNSIIVDAEGGPYTVVLTSGFTYSEGGAYNASTSWPDGSGFQVWAGGSDTYTLSSTSYVFATDNSGIGTTHPVGTDFYIGGYVLKTADASFSGSSVTLTSNPGIVVGDTVYDYSSEILGGLSGQNYDSFGTEMTPRIWSSDGVFRAKPVRSYYDTLKDRMAPEDAAAFDDKARLALAGILTLQYPQINNYHPAGTRTSYVGSIINGNDWYPTVTGLTDYGYGGEEGPDYVLLGTVPKEQAGDGSFRKGVRSFELTQTYDGNYGIIPGEDSINLCSLSRGPWSVAGGQSSAVFGGGAYIGPYANYSIALGGYGSIYSPYVTSLSGSAYVWLGTVPINSIVTSGGQYSRCVDWQTTAETNVSGAWTTQADYSFFPTPGTGNSCRIDTTFVSVDSFNQIVSGKVVSFWNNGILSGTPTVTYDRRDKGTATIAVSQATVTKGGAGGAWSRQAFSVAATGFAAYAGIQFHHVANEYIKTTDPTFMGTGTN